jgi:hypothetical protein
MRSKTCFVFVVIGLILLCFCGCKKQPENYLADIEKLGGTKARLVKEISQLRKEVKDLRD